MGLIFLHIAYIIHIHEVVHGPAWITGLVTGPGPKRCSMDQVHRVVHGPVWHHRVSNWTRPRGVVHGPVPQQWSMGQCRITG